MAQRMARPSEQQPHDPAEEDVVPWVAVALREKKEPEMSFIRLACTEPELVPEGEHELIVGTFKTIRSFTGNLRTIVLKLHAAGHAATILHYLSPPTDDMPPDQQRFRLLAIKRFLVHFQVPHSGGFFEEDLLEATARCWVTQRKDRDGEVCNRVRLPRLKREESTKIKPPMQDRPSGSLQVASGAIVMDAEQRRLAEAIVDGRLKLLKGIDQIAAALALTDSHARTALREGRVQGAWQANRRWFAIRPVLLARQPELPFPPDQGGDDG